MKKLKISQLAPGFRYLQTLALKNEISRGQKRADIPLAVFYNETVRGVE